MSAHSDIESREVGPATEDHTAHAHKEKGAACCGSTMSMGDAAPAGPTSVEGSSFQVGGSDCVEEVSILSRLAGPIVGGVEHPAHA